MSNTADSSSPSEFASSKEEVRFAKIVATPTDSSWSQAYNAGKLFAVLSLTNTSEEEEKLNISGKEILNTLEEEFYTLEEKNFDSIHQAVKTTLEKFSPTLSTSLAIATIKENILYVFLVGNGTILLKRDNKLGILLEKETELTGASGKLQNGDTIILTTEQFLETIPQDVLEKTIDTNSPQEIAETLSPKIHEKELGGAAAIIITYQKEEKEIAATPVEPQESLDADMEIETSTPTPSPGFSLPSFRIPTFPLAQLLPRLFGTMTHSRKMFLSVSLVLVFILIISIVFSIAKRNDAKTKEKFDAVYSEAEKHYDEGTALLTLNKNLAREDLQKALAIIEKELPNFKEGSEEHTKLLDLKKNIEKELGPVATTQSVQTKEVGKSESLYLATLLDNKALYVTQNNDSIFFVDQKGINKVDKNTEDAEQIIEKEDIWETPAGIATYGSHLYLLDKGASQILKFPNISTPTSNYFTNPPELKNANALAIDSDVYVLLSDGTIAKFLKGEQEQFTISGLDGTLNAPTRIFTDTDTSNLYVLDNKNERIVVLSKSGMFIAQYKAGVIKNAQDFEVREKDKKIFVLSGGKIYQIDLQ